MTCRKYLNNGNGTGGCTFGEKCKFVHPKICPSSLKDKTCDNCGPGVRCRRGFHLRGTKFVEERQSSSKGSSSMSSSGWPSENNKDTSSTSNKVPTIDKEVEIPALSKDFLEQVMRQEIRMLLKDMIPKMEGIRSLFQMWVEWHHLCMVMWGVSY